MQKMSYFFPFLCICLDACVAHALYLAQLSPLLLSHPLVTLWVGAATRIFLLTFLIFTYHGQLPWMRSFEGIQSLGVLCFHFPLYTTLMWALGQSTVEEIWGWHSWERVSVSLHLHLSFILYIHAINHNVYLMQTLFFVLQVLQSYFVTVVAWLYWSRYILSLLLSLGRYISSPWRRMLSDCPSEGTGASLRRLMGYMQPYLSRFVIMLCLVILSSYGM